ncbi:RICIN domain-containing protein [Pendulispora rubella]
MYFIIQKKRSGADMPNSYYAICLIVAASGCASETASPDLSFPNDEALVAGSVQASEINAARGWVVKEKKWGTCLDLDHNNGTNGTYVLHWECHGKVNQQWAFRDSGIYSPEMGHNYYEIMAFGHVEKCLDVKSDNGPGSGRDLVIWDCKKTDNQLWEAWTNGFGYWWYSPKSNRITCLDASADGPNALAFRCNHGDNQHWDH